MSDMTITVSGKKRLLTAGKYCDKNIVIQAVGGEGGTCSGNHIIEVAELPTKDIDESAVYLCNGAYYKHGGGLTDVYVKIDDACTSLKEASAESGAVVSFNTIPAKTTDGILPSNGDTAIHYDYMEDDKNVFCYVDGEWVVAVTAIVSDVSEITNNGLYAIVNAEWKKYTSGGESVYSGAIDLSNIPQVDSIDNPTASSPTAVMYDGEIYLLVEGELNNG